MTPTTQHAGELAEQQRGAAHRRQREPVRGSPVSMSRGEVGAGVDRGEQRALHERHREREVAGRSRSGSPGMLRRRVEPGRVDREQDQREQRRRDHHAPAGAACAGSSAAPSTATWSSALARGDDRAPGCSPSRALARRRRPRACARSWRGRRRRASARAAGGRRSRTLLGVERADDVGELSAPPSRRTATAPRRRVRAAAEARRARRRPRRGRSRIDRGRPRRSGARSRPSAPPGVPSATIRPWSMIPTRSASTSASSRYWVVRKTVMPSSRASRATSSHSAVRLCGSRPVVGSSRNRIRGRCTSASARSSRRFMPPE